MITKLLKHRLNFIECPNAAETCCSHRKEEKRRALLTLSALLDQLDDADADAADDHRLPASQPASGRNADAPQSRKGRRTERRADCGPHSCLPPLPLSPLLGLQRPASHANSVGDSTLGPHSLTSAVRLSFVSSQSGDRGKGATAAGERANERARGGVSE